VYIARARVQHLEVDVQVMEPRWLYEKQIESGFTIQGWAWYVAHVKTKPVQIPEDIAHIMKTEMMHGTKGAEDVLRSGPFVGPESVYVVFDEERTAQVILFKYHSDIVVAEQANPVSDDQFEARGVWGTCTRSRELSAFLDNQLPPDEASVFENWIRESRSTDSVDGTRSKTGEHRVGACRRQRGSG